MWQERHNRWALNYPGIHWGEWLDTDEEMVKVESYASLMVVKVKSGAVTTCQEEKKLLVSC